MEETVEAISDRLAPAAGSGFSVGAVIAVFLIVDTFIVVALVLALAPHALWWVLLITVGSPFAAFWLLVVFGWRPWSKKFPAAPQRQDAVVRLSQSIQLGPWMRMNNCIHLAADEDHLHLIPFSMLRWVGAGVISIPWAAISDVRPTRFNGVSRGRVNGRTIAGPTWCLELGAPAADGPDTQGA